MGLRTAARTVQPEGRVSGFKFQDSSSKFQVRTGKYAFDFVEPAHARQCSNAIRHCSRLIAAFGLRASSVADVNKVGTSLITSRRVIFVPNTEIKEELAKTSINITCYDRNGEVVKRVTSSDEGNVEDNEDENENENQNGGGSQNGGNSGGNGSVTTSVSAPSFAGNTQFEESTEVTISGPSGSEIHYTVDGSTPTAESPVYSEPLTFTETTTLKAIAIKDGQSSEVTSRTYTKGTNGGGNGDGTDFD